MNHSNDADRLSDGNLRLVLREKHYAVQWRYHGNWVTYSRDHTTEESVLHELSMAKNNKALEEKGKPLNWRAVEITKTVRRLDDAAE